ncbi:ERAD-associated protein [Knufia peltigerae]|uniref:ERAD-associated protein n=1 Tax=Knufia peltigerae TaxID=1002370 RepID=A0AA38YDQ8_9EURO|nr:ERAD-associated protein [Knufia peltigerae]
MRRFFAEVLLALFCALAIISSHTKATVQAKETVRQLVDAPSDLIPDEEQKQNYWANGGNNVVHEVWSILRDFEPTWKDSVTPAQPTSLLENIWYYLRLIFRTLFMNAPARHDDETPQVKGDLRKAVETLKTAALFEDPDAMFILAEMNFYGNFSYPRNTPESLAWYNKLASLNGNSTAQYMSGLIYGTGLGGAPRDQAKALLYHTFAAGQDNINSEMTLAYRYHAGVGCPRDCNKAVSFYKRVADKAMDFWAAGPPGGLSFTRNAYRWVEVDGGIYGEGASVSSSGPNAPRDGVITTHIDDVLDYLDTKERQGDFTAMLGIGKHYYEAPRGYKKNFRKAHRQFMKVARAYWGKDGKVSPKAPKGIDRVAAKAAAYLGRMFLRGEGVDQNFEKAAMWFKRAIANGDSFAQYHIGLMYRDGLGVPKDGLRAGTYLKAAAEQSLPIAQSALGVLFLDQGDIETASRYFELAAGAGVMEAFYYLAELTNQGVGRERNCGLASVYYKLVAERAEGLHSSFSEANSAYERGDWERALVASIKAAEAGYENAQANVAYLLDRKTSVLDVPGLSMLFSSKPEVGAGRSKLLDDEYLALAYFTRSAKQSNVDSLIKMGDYYLSLRSSPHVLRGLLPNDTKEDEVKSNLERATTCYTTAAESHHSAQALWNLGWMHENGIGSVTQDFHMAKRYYDLALEMNKEAYLPVTLALAKLRLRSWWNGVSGGKVNSIREDEDEDKKRPKSWGEWVNRFLDAAEEMDAQEAAAMMRERDGDEEMLGYAEPGMPGGDSDYAGREGQRHGEDVYGADEWEDIDDGLVESLIIIALAGALALLVYARQARQRGLEQERREAQERARAQAQAQAQPRVPTQPQAQAQQGNGFFPGPGDPEFNNWVAGGVGH